MGNLNISESGWDYRWGDQFSIPTPPTGGMGLFDAPDQNAQGDGHDYDRNIGNCGSQENVDYLTGNCDQGDLLKVSSRRKSNLSVGKSDLGYRLLVFFVPFFRE